jgi:hypothetical protein
MEQDLATLEGLPPPRTKVELIERIPPARHVLETLLAGLPEDRMDKVGPDGWSIKDHLAHLAAWERMVVAHLRTGNDHEVVGLDEAAYANAGLEELNRIIEQRNKNRTLADVLDDVREAHTAVLSLLQDMTDDDLARPYWQDEPDGRTVMEKLTGDTYRHDLEHRRWIGELLDEVSASGRGEPNG